MAQYASRDDIDELRLQMAQAIIGGLPDSEPIRHWTLGLAPLADAFGPRDRMDEEQEAAEAANAERVWRDAMPVINPPPPTAPAGELPGAPGRIAEWAGYPLTYPAWEPFAPAPSAGPAVVPATDTYAPMNSLLDPTPFARQPVPATGAYAPMNSLLDPTPFARQPVPATGAYAPMNGLLDPTPFAHQPVTLNRPALSAADLVGASAPIRAAAVPMPAAAVPTTSTAEAFGRGARKGALLNWDEELAGGSAAGRTTFPPEARDVRLSPMGHLLSAAAGGARMLYDKAAGQDSEAGRVYEQTTAAQKARNEAARTEHPYAFTGGMVAGGAPVGLALPQVTVARGTALVPRAYNAGATGLTYGGLTGAGEGEGWGRLPNAAVGAGIGGGIGFIAPPLASGAATKGMTQETRDRIEQIVTILIQGARRPAIESAIDRE